MPSKTEELNGITGPGVAPKKIKALDDAIEEWRDLVQRRMDLLEKEIESADGVKALMHKHSLATYPYWIDDETKKLVVLEGSESLKMKKAPKPEAADSEDLNEND